MKPNRKQIEAALKAHGPPPTGWFARLLWAWRAARVAALVAP